MVNSERGKIALQISGIKAMTAFSNESGQHCVQRIPPTETKGRRQTSYVMVSVLPMPPKHEFKELPKYELETFCEVGSGPGGQHRNRTASCVRMRHKPTGIEVYIDGRKQQQNKRLALEILSAKVAIVKSDAAQLDYDKKRIKQIGSGSRGLKVRTYNFIKSRAVDHRTGQKTSRVKDVIEKGRFDMLT